MANRILTEGGDGILKEDGSGSIATGVVVVAFAEAGASTCTAGATTPGIDTSAANYLLVFLATATGAAVPSFTDSKGNVYAQLDQFNSSEQRITAYGSIPSSVGAAHTIALPAAGAVCGSIQFLALSVTPKFIVDGLNHSAANTTFLRPGPVTPSKDYAWVLAIAANADVGGSFTIEAPYTIIQQQPCVSGAHYGMCMAWQSQYLREVTNPGFGFTGGSNATTMILAFLDGDAGGVRVTQSVVEAVGSGTSAEMVSQFIVEVLSPSTSPVRYSQFEAEVLTKREGVFYTQMVVEVLSGPPPEKNPPKGNQGGHHGSPHGKKVFNTSSWMPWAEVNFFGSN
jgi:hypothetical protein